MSWRRELIISNCHVLGMCASESLCIVGHGGSEIALARCAGPGSLHVRDRRLCTLSSKNTRILTKKETGRPCRRRGGRQRSDRAGSPDAATVPGVETSAMYQISVMRLRLLPNERREPEQAVRLYETSRNRRLGSSVISQGHVSSLTRHLCLDRRATTHPRADATPA
jgi:hypothetical protein